MREFYPTHRVAFARRRSRRYARMDDAGGEKNPKRVGSRKDLGRRVVTMRDAMGVESSLRDA